MQRRLAAIFAADVVGYSRLVRADEDETLSALSTVRADVVDPLIAKHRGRIVKSMGDGVLVEFSSAVDAVGAGVEVQRSMKAWNDGRPEDRRIVFRVGINIGDVVIDGSDIHGDGVNLAARLEAMAEPGAICVSEAVHDQVRDRLDLTFADLGARQVKNIDRPLHVWQWNDGAHPPQSQERESGLPLPEGGSIAVLPFDNMSGDREQDYFSDGITEDIITEVSRVAGLLVISRNSSFTFKGKALRVSDVCRELGVRYVLEGSVRKVGTRVRITAQLIDGKTDTHVWAERYDRDLTDIFAVQDDVTEKIVRALAANLYPAKGPVPERKETESTKAYDLVLRGRERFRLYTHDSHLQARQFFEQAISFDPRYAAAYAGLALTSLHEWFKGVPEALDQAYKYARKARSLDPSLPAVYEALASVCLFRKEHQEAVSAARQWVQIEPGNAEAYATLAGSLIYSGITDDVLILLDKAIRMNPFFPFYYVLYRGKALFCLERYDDALIDIERAISRNPDALEPHIFHAACLSHLGREGDAKAAFASAVRIFPDLTLGWIQTIFAFKKQTDVARLVAGLQLAGMKS